MKFLEIVNALKDGKKVRRKCWNKSHYWCLDDKNDIRNSKRIIVDDWEIVEKKKTLHYKAELICDNVYYHEEDVKEALKEFIDYLDKPIPKNLLHRLSCKDKAKEIFGDRLV